MQDQKISLIEELLQRGETLLESQRFSEAAGLFEQALKSAPDHTSALCGMAEASFALGDLAAAKHYVGQAVQSNPDDPRTLNNAGVMLFHEKEYEQSAQFLLKAISVRSDYGDAHFNLCSTFGRLTLANQKQATKSNHLMPTLRWISDNASDSSRSGMLDFNNSLRQQLLNRYRDVYEPLRLKILLHSPTSAMGALFYIFESWRECLAFMGIETRISLVGDPLLDTIEEFAPHVLIGVDVPEVGGKIEWKSIYDYINRHQLLIGLCSEFRDQPRPADFYVTFHLDPERDQRLSEVKEPLLSLPFAFNPLLHRMHPAQTLFDFAFVGTNSPLKQKETLDLLVPIVRKYTGILAGTGWPGRFGNFGQADAGVLYNFAAICPNYHLNAQLETYSEVNERTHVLQACGAFQLCDNPKALSELYSPDELAFADSPDEFQRKFAHYLQHPEERDQITRRGMEKAWQNYSQFHVLQKLVDFLASRC